MRIGKTVLDIGGDAGCVVCACIGLCQHRRFDFFWCAGYRISVHHVGPLHKLVVEDGQQRKCASLWILVNQRVGADGKDEREECVVHLLNPCPLLYILILIFSAEQFIRAENDLFISGERGFSAFLQGYVYTGMSEHLVRNLSVSGCDHLDGVLFVTDFKGENSVCICFRVVNHSFVMVQFSDRGICHAFSSIVDDLTADSS